MLDMDKGDTTYGLSVYVAQAAACLINRHWTFDDLKRPAGFDAAAVLSSKTDFAGFMYRNCGAFAYSIIRSAFMELLSAEYKPSFPLSDCGKEKRGAKDDAKLRDITKRAGEALNGDFFVGMDE
jgi:hypothetical protein